MHGPVCGTAEYNLLMILRRFPAIAVLALPILLIACGTAPAIEPTKDLVPTWTVPPLSTIPWTTETPPEVLLPSTWPLSSSGPWLVYRAEDGLVVANPDGTGRTLLLEGQGLGPARLYNFDEIASPSGGWLAVYTFDDPEALIGPSLQIVHVPDGLAVWTTRLLSEEIEAEIAGGAQPGSPAMQAADAVNMPGALAWSPDGKRLAFTAALDGPSSDIYLYDLAKAQVLHVTGGPNQIASLSWSPDGQWIAHQAVKGFGSSAGWIMGSVWTVSPDGRQLNKLYEPESGGEVFVGWSEGNSLISYSFSADGPHDLRAAGADSGIDTVLVPTYFSSAAYTSREGVVAYAVPGAMTYTGAEPGAYLWHPVWGPPRQVDAGDWDYVQWAPASGRFYFEGPSGVLAVAPDGDSIAKFAVVDRVSPSPDGDYVVLWGDGYFDRDTDLKLFTADLEEIKTLASGDFSVVSWRPDSAGVMTMGEAGLEYHPLDGPPTWIDASAMAGFEGGLGWVSR